MILLPYVHDNDKQSIFENVHFIGDVKNFDKNVLLEADVNLRYGPNNSKTLIFNILEAPEYHGPRFKVMSHGPMYQGSIGIFFCKEGYTILFPVDSNGIISSSTKKVYGDKYIMDIFRIISVSCNFIIINSFNGKYRDGDHTVSRIVKRYNEIIDSGTEEEYLNKSYILPNIEKAKEFMKKEGFTGEDLFARGPSI